MRSHRFRADGLRRGMKLHVFSVRLKHPSFPLVAQADIQNLPKTLLGTTGHDWGDYLNAFREIAVHPVRRPYIELSGRRIRPAVREVKDAGVFEEASDDGTDTNVLTCGRVLRDEGSRTRE